MRKYARELLPKWIVTEKPQIDHGKRPQYIIVVMNIYHAAVCQQVIMQELYPFIAVLQLEISFMHFYHKNLRIFLNILVS